MKGWIAVALASCIAMPAAAQAWSAADSSTLAARRLREAADKREFFERALQTGGGTYLHMALEAVSQCLLVNGASAFGAEARLAGWLKGQPQYEKRIRAARLIIEPCHGFELSPVSNTEISALRSRVAAEKDAMGRAHALGNLKRPEGDGDARALSRELIATGDPHVIRLVALDMRRRSAGVLSQDGELSAWMWALCDLGIECDPDSHVGRTACLAGECDWRHIDEVGARVFGNAGAKVSRERKDAVAEALRKRDWKALGL